MTLPAAMLVGAGLSAAPLLIQAGRCATTQPAAQAHSHMPAPHRIVIQVSEDDLRTMNLAINNAENLTKYFEDKGETAQIEIVAYGPGLRMLRSDSSPVMDRLASVAAHSKNLQISACGTTMEKAARQEGKPVSLIPEARVVTSGIARIVELEEQGWTYIRP